MTAEDGISLVWTVNGTEQGGEPLTVPFFSLVFDFGTTLVLHRNEIWRINKLLIISVNVVMVLVIMQIKSV